MSQPHRKTKTLRKHLQGRRSPDTRGADWEDLLFVEPPHGARPQEALWRAVIVQMVTDALSNSHKAELRQCKREALDWLRGYGRDFRLVCLYAGLEPAWVHERIQQLLERSLPETNIMTPISSSFTYGSIRYGLNPQDFSSQIPIHAAPSPENVSFKQNVMTEH